MVFDQIQKQQRFHPVKGKPLPHFGKKADIQAFRVAQKNITARNARCGLIVAHEMLLPLIVPPWKNQFFLRRSQMILTNGVKLSGRVCDIYH
jgi:hypothetical protein